MQNWNLNGQQDWSTLKAWAGTTLDAFAGSNDRRLPGVAEYANLFTAYGDLRSNTMPFVDVQSGLYWSGTELTAGSSAFFFGTPFGCRRVRSQLDQFFAVAVRPGEVTASVFGSCVDDAGESMT